MLEQAAHKLWTLCVTKNLNQSLFENVPFFLDRKRIYLSRRCSYWAFHRTFYATCWTQLHPENKILQWSEILSQYLLASSLMTGYYISQPGQLHKYRRITTGFSNLLLISFAKIFVKRNSVLWKEANVFQLRNFIRLIFLFLCSHCR